MKSSRRSRRWAKMRNIQVATQGSTRPRPNWRALWGKHRTQTVAACGCPRDPDHGKQGAAEALGSQPWCSQAKTAAPISPERKRLDLRKAYQIKMRNDALARLL